MNNNFQDKISFFVTIFIIILSGIITFFYFIKLPMTGNFYDLKFLTLLILFLIIFPVIGFMFKSYARKKNNEAYKKMSKSKKLKLEKEGLLTLIIIESILFFYLFFKIFYFKDLSFNPRGDLKIIIIFVLLLFGIFYSLKKLNDRGHTLFERENPVISKKEFVWLIIILIVFSILFALFYFFILNPLIFAESV